MKSAARLSFDKFVEFYVGRHKLIIVPDGCWLWQGYTDRVRESV